MTRRGTGAPTIPVGIGTTAQDAMTDTLTPYAPTTTSVHNILQATEAARKGTKVKGITYWTQESPTKLC